MVKAVFGVSVVSLVLLASTAFGPPQATTADEPVTFSKQVAPILHKNCTSCHRPGDIAPMSLLTYKDARPWARSIRQRVVDREMPPWHADPHYGTFSNDRRLSDQDIAIIDAWASHGAPEGDPKDLPPSPEYPDGWRIGTPDVILSMQEPFDVPAEGVVDYQYFTIPTNFAADRWIRAAEIRPGDRSVVHHVIVFVQDPGPATPAPGIKIGRGIPADATPRRADAPLPAPKTGSARAPVPLGYLLVGEAPGTQPIVFRPEAAKRLKTGSRLTFQMHYTPNGKATKDVTRVGLIFAKEPVEHRIRSIPVMNQRLLIPPGAASYEVKSEVTFTEDARIWSVFPHMHLRGKDFEYRIYYPDGRSEIILSVPKYDFSWQGDYVFTTPIVVPKDSRLECTAHFDNSPANKANPDPSKEVRWGDQTFEEMMIGWTAYSLESQRSSVTSAPPQSR